MKTTPEMSDQLDELEKLAETHELKFALEWIREHRADPRVWHPKACKCARCILVSELK